MRVSGLLLAEVLPLPVLFFLFRLPVLIQAIERGSGREIETALTPAVSIFIVVAILRLAIAVAERRTSTP
jgi:hypothetical protein